MNAFSILICQDGACLARKDITCIPLLRNVATGLFLHNFNVKVFFELTHLTKKAMITAIVSTFYQFIHLYFSDDETKFYSWFTTPVFALSVAQLDPLHIT